MRFWIRCCLFTGLSTTAIAQPSRIVFTHAPEGSPGYPVNDIYSMWSDGSHLTPLTRDGHSHSPSSSPDGRSILFIHDTELSEQPPYRESKESVSHHPVELQVMHADGSDRRTVWRLGPVIYGAAWSPDGQSLAVSWLRQFPTASEDQRSGPGLYILRADGSGEPRLLAKNAFTPAWSPDGKRLAYTLEQPRGQWSIHVIGIDGKHDVRLNGPSNSPGSPAWSPDGSRIAFEEFSADNSRQRIMVMNADGSGILPLTHGADWSYTHPSWPPDGKRIVVAGRSAAPACGHGISSTGQPIQDCKRRLFVVPLEPSLAAPIQLSDLDAFSPSFLAVP